MSAEYPKYANEMDDGRRKLSSDQVAEIVTKSRTGISCVALAREYGVSKSVILYHVNPAVKERITKYRQSTWKDRYSKDLHREAMRKYREKKRRLLNNEK